MASLPTLLLMLPAFKGVDAAFEKAHLLATVPPDRSGSGHGMQHSKGMKFLHKVLILAEIVVCFGPLVVMWLLGLIAIPSALFAATQGDFNCLYLLVFT